MPANDSWLMTQERRWNVIFAASGGTIVAAHLQYPRHDRISGIGKLKRSRLLLLARNVALDAPVSAPCQTRSTTSTWELNSMRIITKTNFPIAFTP
jgi:hypothetical protein